ncbi:hypothetical protein J8I29_21860 [Labrys sp. LIt4]|uniref:hypothetical protein n=1 Tax=Labrys sp. LIt4 TaxID=2821355 RepID=UPI001AE00D16|nr:hypothetical protein [Labrys sp. LIt4]MBP0581990.1 hypothetical protein [Labrys sp. LIt4]
MKLQLALGAAALALMLPGQALADCDITDALLKQAYPDAQQGDNGLLVKGGAYDRAINPGDVVCKAWPYRPELMLAAVPLIEAEPPIEGENKGDVEIIIADVATGKPVARRLEKGMAFSDAIRFGSMSLDTARYDVGDGLRAFGLRTSQSGSSRLNPYGEQALWMYIFDKGRIERVLDGLIVERSNGENNGECEGESTTLTRTVKLGPKAGAGYRDLAVEQSLTRETWKTVAGECRADKRPGKPAGFKLVYDNGHYRPVGGVKPRSEDGDIEKDLFSLIETGKQP